MNFVVCATSKSGREDGDNYGFWQLVGEKLEPCCFAEGRKAVLCGPLRLLGVLCVTPLPLNNHPLLRHILSPSGLQQVAARTQLFGVHHHLLIRLMPIPLPHHTPKRIQQPQINAGFLPLLEHHCKHPTVRVGEQQHAAVPQP